jgi:glycosyltransferase involved in cell wall biosynthesis
MTQNPIDIAYMLNQFEDGGAERQLVELIRRLDRSRYRPVLYLGVARGTIADELGDLDVPLRFVRGRMGSKGAALRLARALRQDRPRIVHSWQFVANTWGRIAGRLAGIPVIITSDRGMDTEVSALHARVDSWLAPLSTRVIVNADAVAENVHRNRGVPREKILTIYNGVDLERYTPRTSRDEARRALGLPVDRPVVGMVASFCWRKRWDVFLTAVAGVSRSRRITALCVGDGELRPEMEQRARELGLGEVARFLGLRSDIPEIMAAQDVSVLSSDDEGMPNVVMQAMAAGRPVVATDAGGTREIIVDGETGFVVPCGDSTALADGVGTLLADPVLAARFGAAGRSRVERTFTFDACVGRTVALYEELLALKTPGTRLHAA